MKLPQFGMRDDWAFSPLLTRWWNPANVYLFKINSRNTRKKCKICSKLTSWRHSRCSGVFVVNFEHNYFTPFSRVSIVVFEQENVCWEVRVVNLEPNLFHATLWCLKQRPHVSKKGSKQTHNPLAWIFYVTVFRELIGFFGILKKNNRYN